MKLPYDDPAVDALDDVSRHALSRRWEERVRSELEVGRAFEDLVDRLRHVNADPKVVAMARDAADQERRHATICHRLSERYGARTVTLPQLDWQRTRFGYDDERYEVMFQIAGMCCVNETLASVWLRRCATIAQTPLARAVNQEHLREEVLHARLGWAHLASDAVDGAMRKELRGRLDELIRVNAQQWVDKDKHLGQGVPSHGYPSLTDTRALIIDALAALVRPGFERVGV